MTPMLVGTALALLALAFVLYPLFQEPLAIGRTQRRFIAPQPANSSVDALREIEFDYATGKLSEHDYNQLRSTYTQKAVAAMRGEVDELAVICVLCGPRPEPEAAFCSNCGRSLAA